MSKIDYNNLNNHVVLVKFGKENWVCDADHDTQEDKSNYQIVQLKEKWCDFWSNIQNKTLIRKYFQGKYPE